MRSSMAVLLAIIVACCLAGCGNKAQKTTATQVESPVDKPAPVKPTKVTLPKPKPIPPAPKPVLGKDGFLAFKNGLKYRDLKVGRGAVAMAGQAIEVHYKGWLDNGAVFDESKPRGEPFPFTLGNADVIPGWDQGVAGMRVGGKRELIIPPSLGYQDQEMGKIPPNSTLHFEIELLKAAQ